MRKKILPIIIVLVLTAIAVAAFCVFFDEAVLVRKGTVFHKKTQAKLVALTFDDGPSPVWTPKILAELKRANIKATFFMLGEHVKKYPEIVRQVEREGHEIENHTYDHHVLIYYKMEELEKEIKDTENVIRDITGKSTKYFRPPKAWITAEEKNKIEEMGYKIVLWSLNSKDWVNFDDKYIIRYITKNIRPGDIILFHDSGGVFSIEGGSRKETVSAIFRLSERLRAKGYEFVTVSQFLEEK